MAAALPARAATVTNLYTFGTLRRDPQRPVLRVTVFRGAIYGELAGSGLYKLPLKSDKLRLLHFGESGAYTDSENQLVELDGALYGYGETETGGSTIIRIDPLTHSGSTIYTFPGNAGEVTAGGGLAVYDGKLYGTLLDLRGKKASGQLFSFDPASATFTTVHTQTAEEGDGLDGGLTNHAGMFYGTAVSHTTKSHWNVFQFDPASGEETIVRRFGADSPIPGGPEFALLVQGNDIYGFTDDYSTHDVWIYRVNIKTAGARLLQTFDYQATGVFPNQSLVFQNGLLYGTIEGTNANPYGSIYTLDPKTTELTTIYAFTGGANGGAPQAGLTLAHGVLYGTTYTTEQGNDGGGTVFKLTP